MTYDTIIVGGSFAGLSAALYLVRTRRSVLVLDTGKPRNRFAAASHGFFAQDGSDPMVMLETMRQQVRAYPGASFLDARAVDAVRAGDAFRVTLESGEMVTGARLLLAYGITDILPERSGLVERWGKSVLHCPYCHGYEVSGQRLGVLNLSEASVHQARLIAEWGPTTLFLDGGTIAPEAMAALRERDVVIEPEPVESLVGDGGNLTAIRLEDGSERPIDALFIGPANRPNSDLAEKLGCSLENGILGQILTVDDMKATTVAGVHAAGDITRAGHTITFACADGVMAALAIHRSLAFGD